MIMAWIIPQFFIGLALCMRVFCREYTSYAHRCRRRVVIAETRKEQQFKKKTRMHAVCGRGFKFLSVSYKKKIDGKLYV